MLSLAQLFMTPWTVSQQSPLSMGFSQQEYWSDVLFPPPEDLPTPGMAFVSLTSPALAGRFFTTSAAQEAPKIPHFRHCWWDLSPVPSYLASSSADAILRHGVIFHDAWTSRTFRGLCLQWNFEVSVLITLVNSVLTMRMVITKQQGWKEY